MCGKVITYPYFRKYFKPYCRIYYSAEYEEKCPEQLSGECSNPWLRDRCPLWHGTQAHFSAGGKGRICVLQHVLTQDRITWQDGLDPLPIDQDNHSPRDHSQQGILSAFSSRYHGLGSVCWDTYLRAVDLVFCWGTLPAAECCFLIHQWNVANCSEVLQGVFVLLDLVRVNKRWSFHSWVIFTALTALLEKFNSPLPRQSFAE